MRLINTSTLEIEEVATDPPPYAILSHRWIGQEITYEKYLDPKQRRGPGYEKVVDFCEFIRKWQSRPRRPWPAVQWVWVDTCCIDKRSSAELSEAINSMWNYYRDSQFCVAYLVDVPSGSGQDFKKEILESEWFKRGWTLQELLAPERMLFCNQSWDVLGCKEDLVELLSQASGISGNFLLDDETMLRTTSIAQRMSWASNRFTTRKEDQAYCLFGLFDVHLPLIYGEGDRAFIRLQEEIVRRSDDESIFAWSHIYGPDDMRHLSDLFAPSPHEFRHSGHIVPYDFSKRRSFRVTHKGVELETTLLGLPNGSYILELMCAITDNEDHQNPRQCLLILQEVRAGIFVRKHLIDWEEFEGPYNDIEGAINSRTGTLVSKGAICVRSPHVFEEVLDSEFTHPRNAYKVL